ncbi:tetratricopeptide repeat protein [Marixanthomonas ophiurae]|uniref:Tetratricopeptide repeat protein n=1 Tax=Marixanthomonas ophiurae TaxID=387659 RepID=A0A3E1QAX7_9FLAO|nr:tetratricopeptide repeat protein [Marixanthomonas ophiurae]RFN59290.1 tetratricopeptide repeat protein [Marixanthomonas ophiurae]
MKRLLILGMLLVSALGFAQNDALFEQGKENYKNAKFSEAVTNWKKIVDNGQQSAELYFNLGNAHYKLNNIGPSIYYFEKALQLQPNDDDIKTNLAFAENARIDVIEPLPKTIFSRWYKNVSGVFTYNGWAIVSVIGVILFVLLFLLYWFSISETKKRVYFTTSLFSVVVCITALVMAFQTYVDFNKNKPAIIFAENTEVKGEPNMGSDTAFELHEGTKVQIIGNEQNWVRIELADGKDGWMPVNDLKQL